MKGLLAFLVIFCVIVIVHEFGHFYVAKRSGILVREFSVGMGPKLFSHMAKDGTLYTLRLLPLGGYVRMAGWGEDVTTIRTGQLVALSLNEANQVTRINMTSRQLDPNALPMQVTSSDLEGALTITGLVLDETRTYTVCHDATIVEGDGSEVRIAPKDVQYQNASFLGKLATNMAGPFNNFVLGLFLCLIIAFMQGGVSDRSSNQVTVLPDSPVRQAGLETGDRITAINGKATIDYDELYQTLQDVVGRDKGKVIEVTASHKGQSKTVSVTPKKDGTRYVIGISPIQKTGFWDKIVGGCEMALQNATAIISALKDIVASFSLDKLGGPVAIYSMSSQVADQGIIPILSFMAMLSINLGIVNLFPLPALDGGKIIFAILEAIRRKPLKQSTETYVTIAGVAIIFVLMVAVTWNDIMRIFFR